MIGILFQLVWKLSSCSMVVKLEMELTGLKFIPVFTYILPCINQASGLNFEIQLFIQRLHCGSESLRTRRAKTNKLVCNSG